MILKNRDNRPNSQVQQCNNLISHNALFCNRNVHTCAHFCYKMMHCGIFNLCIVGFMRWVYQWNSEYSNLNPAMLENSHWKNHRKAVRMKNARIRLHGSGSRDMVLCYSWAPRVAQYHVSATRPVRVDGLAPVGARPSAGTAMTKSRFWLCIYVYS